MRRYSFALTVAAVATVMLAGTAIAQPADVPLSGDIRATAHSGNVVEKDCAELFPGSHAIATGDLTYSVDATNTYLDVTAVADGIELAGVIVKGGPAYNKYLAAGEDLHAPLVSQRQAGPDQPLVRLRHRRDRDDHHDHNVHYGLQHHDDEHVWLLVQRWLDHGHHDDHHHLGRGRSGRRRRGSGVDRLQRRLAGPAGLGPVARWRCTAGARTEACRAPLTY